MAPEDQRRGRDSTATPMDCAQSPVGSCGAGGRIMRVALINPNWSFEGSIYFGCREPHLPLEYGYARTLLEAGGHDVVIVDGQLDDLGLDDIRSRVADFGPDVIVITTAPSYLFWRCAPPELRVPQQVLSALEELPGVRVAVGPH